MDLISVQPDTFTRGPASPSPERPSPALLVWFGWLVPSLADLIFVLIFLGATVGTFAPRLLGDSSIGWHIRNGERMLTTHTITRTDSFSSGMQGRPWYAWEWLYDATIAEFHRWMGLNGVVFFTALVAAAAFALVFSWATRRGGGLIVTLVFLLFAVGASTIHLLARPHVLSWLLAMVWFQQLDSYETVGNTRTKQLLWLPLLMLLWVNVHGGFVLGFVLLGLYLLSAGWQWLLARNKSPQGFKDRTTWLSGIFALCGLASLINPFGYHLHVHVYRYLSDHWLMNHIEEFQSPNFHGVAERCFIVLLLLTFLGLTVRRRNLRSAHLLVLLFAVFSGLSASRNLPIASLLLVLLIAPVLTEAFYESGDKVSCWLRKRLDRLRALDVRMMALQRGMRGHLWPVLAVAMVFAACLQGGKLGAHTVMHAQFDPRHLPVGAVDFFQQQRPDEPILSLDTWGGYLIYRLSPLTRVYVDDRHDLYGAEFLKNYLKIIRGAPDWKATLDETRVPWVLVPEGSTLANLLQGTDSWTIAYRDNTTVLFHRLR